MLRSPPPRWTHNAAQKAYVQSLGPGNAVQGEVGNMMHSSIKVSGEEKLSDRLNPVQLGDRISLCERAATGKQEARGRESHYSRVRCSQV